MNTPNISLNPEPVVGDITGEAPAPTPAMVPVSSRAPLCDPGLAGLDMSASASLHDEPSASPAEDGDVMKWGFVPLYRAFQEESWWVEKPWDRAHFFLELYLRARRNPGSARIGPTARGEVVTAYTALANDSGRDVKTVTRWCKDFQKLGEIKVANMGRNGIVIKICKYETYALKDRGYGRNHGRKDGVKGGEIMGGMMG